MKKFSKLALILWAVSAFYLLGAFSFIISGKIADSVFFIVAAVVFLFAGWLKRKPIAQPAPKSNPQRQPQAPALNIIHELQTPPIPHITTTTSVSPHLYDKDDDIVTVSARKLSTIKELKTFENYIVIDFETTGFSAKTDKAIEVACLKVLNGESYEYQTLINPQTHISSRITKINGLTDADVADYPTITYVAKQLHDFCGDLPFVAHNASFDMGFLKQAYIEAGLEANVSYVDTLRLSRLAFPEYDTHRLEFLIKELNLAKKQTHRAMDDVHCTKKLFDICIAEIIEQKEMVKQKNKKKVFTISE